MDSSIYNATVIGKIIVNPDLMIVQISTDEPNNEFPELCHLVPKLITQDVAEPRL
jgi:hypothetical protein